MAREKILIVGGAGFLGSHLSEKLLLAGNEVVVLDNYDTGSPQNVDHLRDHVGFHFDKHDITLPWKGSVDQIYNLALSSSSSHSLSHPVSTLKTSVLGMINLLDLARESRARILQVSSSKVYGHATVSPISEEYWGNVNPLGKQSPYSEGKRVAESLTAAYHRQMGVDARIGRLFNIYGPRMPLHDGRAIPSFISQALQGKDITIIGNGQQRRSYLYVDDAVDALIRLMNSPSERNSLLPMNIGGAEEITIGTLADLIIQLTGSSSKITYLRQNQDSAPHSKPAIRYAENKLDWKPYTSLKEGLMRTITRMEESMRSQHKEKHPVMSWVEMG